MASTSDILLDQVDTVDRHHQCHTFCKLEDQEVSLARTVSNVSQALVTSDAMTDMHDQLALFQFDEVIDGTTLEALLLNPFETPLSAKGSISADEDATTGLLPAKTGREISQSYPRGRSHIRLAENLLEALRFRFLAEKYQHV